MKGLLIVDIKNMEVPINYWAILACGVAMMVLGFLWYGPLFGKKWSQLMGWGVMTPELMAEKQKQARPGYAISFVGALIMAYVLAHGLAFGNAYLQMSGVGGNMMGAFWYWLGFVVPVTVGTVIWDGKPWLLWVINVGYYLVGMLIMATILAVMP
jgi:hypothetical protein